ncbi:MAG: polysaccharide deacetylase family protein [Myxococcota bacterium]
MSARGHLLISLDFELHWGVRDHTPVDGYRENLLGVREAVPRTLDLFRSRGICATWATVGMLMAEDRDELEACLPRVRPRYADPRLDPYADLGGLGRNEVDDPFHFAPSLVRHIAETPGQEIGTHTFSHFYPLEPGATLDAFVADLQAARGIMARKGLPEPRSIVFPRNQYGPDHVRVLSGLGIRCYRGAASGRWNRPSSTGDDGPVRRAARLLDTYLPLSRDPTRPVAADGAVNLPASRFLRPHSPALRALEPARLARIERGMTAAARGGRDYHLWWHPHNFGVHLEQNLGFLSRVLDQFGALAERYGMASVRMADRATA